MLKYFSFLTFLVSSYVHMFAIIDLGEINRQGIPEQIKISFSQKPNQLDQSAKHAFRLHGAYTITENKNAHYSIKFDQIASNGVQLTIYNAQKKPIHTSNTYGKTLNNALLKACDIVVYQTSRTPGFFAGKIAFVGERNSSNKQIFTSDILFSDIQQLTFDKADSVTPHFSPDGNKVIYTGYYKTGFPDLFVIDIKSQKRRSIASFKGTNTGGTFSPINNQIAMTLSTKEGGIDLFVADHQGNQRKRLTKSKSLSTSPNWSPDGSTIIYASDDMGSPQLYTYNLRTGTNKRIPTNISRYCSEPSYNFKNPNIVAFTAANAKSFQISIFDFQSNQAKIITNPPQNHQEPTWLNDGRHLICTEKTASQRKLYILDTFTGKLAPLAPEFGNTSQASFVYAN